jgi:hypothetical protein
LDKILPFYEVSFFTSFIKFIVKMKNEKMLNEVNQIHNFISSSGSDFLTSFGSGSGSASQKVTDPTVPVPQHS